MSMQESCVACTVTHVDIWPELVHEVVNPSSLTTAAIENTRLIVASRRRERGKDGSSVELPQYTVQLFESLLLILNEI